MIKMFGNRLNKSMMTGTLLSLLMVYVLAIMPISDEHLFPIILIPITYVFLFVFVLDITGYFNTPGLFIINLLYLLRYFALPLTIILFEKETYLIKYKSGTWLLLYEEIFSFFVYAFLLSNRFSKLRIKNRPIVLSNLKRQLKVFKRVFLCLIFTCVLFYYIDPSLYDNFGIITNIGRDYLLELMEKKDNTTPSLFNTVASNIIYVTYLILPLFLALVFYNIYEKKRKWLYFILTICVPLIVSIIFIWGSDRGGIILRSTALLFFFFRLFPTKQIKIMKITLIPMGLLVVYLILARMLDDSAGGIVSQMDTGVVAVNYLQSYLASIKNCTDAVIIYQTYPTGIGTFFNDLTGNVPILSHFSNAKYSCNGFYESYLNASDQVLPLVGNGLMYFGYLFAPVLIFFTINIVLHFEKKYKLESNPLYIYMYSYIAVQLAFCHYQNVQLIMLYLSCYILPLWLVFFVVKKMS